MRSALTRACPRAESLERRTLLSFNPISVDPLDKSFGGGDGIVSHPDAGQDVAPAATALQPDGKIVAVGTRVTLDLGDVVVARYNADGTVDTTFGDGGRVVTDFDHGDDSAWDVVVTADGKIAVLGHSSTPTGPAYVVARYNSDGSLDATFDGDGKVIRANTPTFPSALAAAPGGKLVMAGPMVGISTGVVRLNADGSPDAGFGVRGTVTYDIPAGILTQAIDVAAEADGKVVIVGQVAFRNGATTGMVARFNVDGSLDPSFRSGSVSTGVLQKVALDAAGDLLVSAEGAKPSLWRLRPDGNIDYGFGQLGQHAFDLAGARAARAVLPQPDGRIVLAFHQIDGVSGYPFSAVARVNADGSTDTSFGGGDGVASLPAAAAFHGAVDAVVEPSGRIVALGEGLFGSRKGFSLAALDAAGEPDGTFAFSGRVNDQTGRTGTFYDVLALPDGKLLAAGVTSGGAYLARFLADGTPDATFGSNGRVIREVGGTLTRLVLQPDGKFLAHGSVLARFLPDGTLDPSFGGGDGIVTEPATGDGLSLQGDGKILVTEGATVARYNPDGTLDAGFAGGGYATFNAPIGRINPADPNSQPYAGFVAEDVAYQPSSGKIVVGGHTDAGNTALADWAVARLNPDGTLDSTFGAGGLVSLDSGGVDSGGRIALAPDGTIYMAGDEADQHTDLLTFAPDGASAKSTRLPYSGGTNDVAVGPDGRVTVVGDLFNVGFSSSDKKHHDVVVTRMTPDGPAAFQTDVFGRSDDFGLGVAVAADGDAVVAGSADSSPVLLRYRGAAFDAPQVQQVWVDGSEWAPEFRQFLASAIIPGSATYGLDLFYRGSPRFTLLPFVNLDRVSFQFDRPVTVSRDDLRVRGVKQSNYAISDVRYDADTRTAVWTLAAPIGADKVVFELDAAKYGGESMRLDVLPGDVNRDGAVLADDFSDVKRRFFTSTTNRGSGVNTYSSFSDVNGSGSILADDYSEVKKRFFTRLPNGEPAPAAAVAVTAAPARRRPVTRTFFGSSPLLG